MGTYCQKTSKQTQFLINVLTSGFRVSKLVSSAVVVAVVAVVVVVVDSCCPDVLSLSIRDDRGRTTGENKFAHLHFALMVLT
jgi:hypothetical protein